MRRFVRSIPAVCLALAACGGAGTDPATADASVEMNADQILYDIVHFMTAEGIRRARLVADTAYFYEAEDSVELRTIDLVLYDAAGDTAATVTARRGRLDNQTQEMVAIGNVVVLADPDRRIETEELHYNPTTDRLWSDVETRYRADGRDIRGDGFESDGRLSRVEVRNPSGTARGVELEF